MAEIVLDKVTKLYPDGAAAVSDVDITIADGEFIILVGPSGCGKRHAIAEVARQSGVAVAHHDLAQGAVVWGRLGGSSLRAGLRAAST